MVAKKKCKICGKEYEHCRTTRRVEGIFRWQDVACCAEHGSIYLTKIEESRASVQNEDCEEYNELFEKDFDDGSEEITIEK